MNTDEKKWLHYDSLNADMKAYMKQVMDIYTALENQVTEDQMGLQNGNLSIADKFVFSMLLAGKSVINPERREQYTKVTDLIEDSLSFHFSSVQPLEEERYYDSLYWLQFEPFLNQHLSLSEPMMERPYYLVCNLLNNQELIKKSFDDMKPTKGIGPWEEKLPKQEEGKKEDFVMTSQVFDLLPDIKKKFIAQTEFAQNLFYNLVMNQRLARAKEYQGERSIIFVDGSSGTGKTAITREIAEKLEVPLTTTSITNYSAAGYVGGDLKDLLVRLYEKADGDLKKAEQGIVVLDEFDKISYSVEADKSLAMKKAVQQQLLDFMGGGKYDLQIKKIEDGKPVQKGVSFDTSSLTFVCLGALTDVREQQPKKPIGFERDISKESTDHFVMSPQVLLDVGLEKELVNRINTYLHTEDYTKEDYVAILKESEISPILGLKNLVSVNENHLTVEEDAYESIAEEACHLHMGARGLQTVVNNIRTSFLDTILEKEGEEIRINHDVVKSTMEKTFDRKVRK